MIILFALTYCECIEGFSGVLHELYQPAFKTEEKPSLILPGDLLLMYGAVHSGANNVAVSIITMLQTRLRFQQCFVWYCS